MPRDSFDKLLTAGLVYTAVVPVKKPGGYQLRAVVRDSASQRPGSAMQFVEVPDLKKKRLTLSGIVMGATPPKPDDGKSSVPIDRTQIEGMPAVRIFKSGAVISYAYKVLNANLNVDKKPELHSQLRLFRDGKMVYTTRGASVVADAAQTGKQLVTSLTASERPPAPPSLRRIRSAV